MNRPIDATHYVFDGKMLFYKFENDEWKIWFPGIMQWKSSNFLMGVTKERGDRKLSKIEDK